MSTQQLHDCNGIEMAFPQALSDKARNIYDEHVASNLDDAWDVEEGVGFSATSSEYNFYYTNPPSNWGYRLQWVYADSVPTLARFQVESNEFVGGDDNPYLLRLISYAV